MCNDDLKLAVLLRLDLYTTQGPASCHALMYATTRPAVMQIQSPHHQQIQSSNANRADAFVVQQPVFLDHFRFHPPLRDDKTRVCIFGSLQLAKRGDAFERHAERETMSRLSLPCVVVSLSLPYVVVRLGRAIVMECLNGGEYGALC
jgi:hypothetical protein